MQRRVEGEARSVVLGLGTLPDLMRGYRPTIGIHGWVSNWTGRAARAAGVQHEPSTSRVLLSESTAHDVSVMKLSGPLYLSQGRLRSFSIVRRRSR